MRRVRSTQSSSTTPSRPSRPRHDALIATPVQGDTRRPVAQPLHHRQGDGRGDDRRLTVVKTEARPRAVPGEARRAPRAVRQGPLGDGDLDQPDAQLRAGRGRHARPRRGDRQGGQAPQREPRLALPHGLPRARRRALLEDRRREVQRDVGSDLEFARSAGSSSPRARTYGKTDAKQDEQEVARAAANRADPQDAPNANRRSVPRNSTGVPDDDRRPDRSRPANRGKRKAGWAHRPRPRQALRRPRQAEPVGVVRRPHRAQRQRHLRACSGSPPTRRPSRASAPRPSSGTRAASRRSAARAPWSSTAQVRQSCSCLIDEYAPNDGDTVTLEPMSKFPVIRDLWVDRERMFHNLKRVKAWVPIDGTYSPRRGAQGIPDKQLALQAQRVHVLRVLPRGLPPVQPSKKTRTSGTPPSSAPTRSARPASSTSTRPASSSRTTASTPSWARAASRTAATPRTASRSAPRRSR
jgi:hypothetical protein